MKSRKPILPRWWHTEIKFMQSAGFRVVIGIIRLAIVGYCVFCVSNWVIQKREHNRLLQLYEQSKSYGYVPPRPSASLLNEAAPTNSSSPTGVGIGDKEKLAKEPTPQWDWVGDIEIADSVGQEVDDKPLSDTDLDELEIEVLTEESAALRKKSDEAYAKAEEELRRFREMDDDASVTR